jgi:hypothetical protein
MMERAMTRATLLLAALCAFGVAGVARADRKARAWEGTVARIGRDGSVYVTAGSASGLWPGEQLAVRRPGRPNADRNTHDAGQKATGRGRARTIAVLQVERHVDEALSACSVAQGGHVKVGDAVVVDPNAVVDEDAAPEEDDAPPPERPVPRPGERPAPKRDEAKAKPAKGPAPPARSETTPKNGRCPDGKFINVATSGHCCWPNQVWSDDTKECIGAPRCPSSLRREGKECVPRNAPPGEG